MAISLASVANAQSSGLTGRRTRIPYNQILVSQIPGARQVEQTRLTDLARTEALNQDQRQFAADQALKTQIAGTQEEQANKAATIQGTNTALTLAAATKGTWMPYAESIGSYVGTKLKDIAKPVLDKISGPGTPAPAAEPVVDAAPVSGDAGTVVAPGETTLGNASSGLDNGVRAQQATNAGADTAAVTDAAAGTFGVDAAGNAVSDAAALNAADSYAMAGSNTAAMGAGETGASSALGAVALPLAIITAASMAREKFGGTKKVYSEKSGSERVFDDPLAGLTANTAGTLAGDNSGIAKPAMQVGEQFGHYAGGPIAKALSGDFAGASSELNNAPKTTAMQVLGTNETGGEIVNAVLNPAGFAIDKLQGLFCFLAGTPIEMADGDERAVETIDLLEDCAEGGQVTGKGVTLATDLYDYEGIGVTGSHAVYEDGIWKRVHDSQKAKNLNMKDFHRVYIINNVNHILKVKGITFADYGELDGGENFTATQRIAIMNGSEDVKRRT